MGAVPFQRGSFLCVDALEPGEFLGVMPSSKNLILVPLENLEMFERMGVRFPT